MTTDDPIDDEVRAFKEALSHASAQDIHGLLASLTSGSLDPLATTGPHLRRPPREDVAVYRIRVDLDGFRPPIWRRLNMRSDVTLDVVHDVLQQAFGWWDYHLHRFALGSGTFDRDSEFFLCPFDVEDGDGDGTPEQDVRLDETLQEPGDVLHYVYDYGDNWQLTLKLEKILAADDGTPAATCVTGRRAAPPEDSRGEDLDEILDDAAHFDPAEVNAALDELFSRSSSPVHPGLLDLADRLRHTDIGPDLSARVAMLSVPAEPLPTSQKAAALRGYQWLLDRAVGGLPLTAAGYLRPADVEAASAVVPAVGDWIGKKNREDLTLPLLNHRESMQAMKLLRKFKGSLKLTRLAARAQRDTEELWDHLVAYLTPGEAGTPDHDATLLLLAYAATSGEKDVPFDAAALALGHLGWVRPDRRELSGTDVRALRGSPWEALINVADRPRTFGDRDQLSPAAAALARDVVVPRHPAP